MKLGAQREVWGIGVSKAVQVHICIHLYICVHHLLLMLYAHKCTYISYMRVHICTQMLKNVLLQRLMYTNVPIHSPSCLF